jgi:hypothetical protein
MESQKSTNTTSLNPDSELKIYIKEKKEENLALKKLLTALETAKKKRILK